jgi:hypothetical protein
VSRNELAAPVALERYLARLATALAALPESERREILRETRSHVLERALRSPDRATEAVLAELGPPADYARPFLPEAGRALGTPTSALHRLALVATAGWRTFPILAVVLASYTVAVSAFAIAVWKIVEPDGTGFWVNDLAGERPSFGLAVSDPRQKGREVLGYWLVPIGLGIAAGIHVAMSALLRRVLRRDRRSTDD